MNALSVPITQNSARDIADVRGDRGFRWVVTAAGWFVLISLAAAALSMLWGGREAFQTFG